jgi:GxxExxY protein
MTKLIYADLTYILRGAFFEVYRNLKGTGISEASWEEALCTVWQAQNIPFKRQPAYEIGYKDHHLALFYPDLIAYDKILVELKAVDALCPLNKAQILSYLKVPDLKLGLLVNFGGEDIEIERVPNFLAQRSTTERPMPMSVRDDLLYPELTYAIQGALFEVHSTLGPGFIHYVYCRASEIELQLCKIPVQRKQEVIISFRGKVLETVPCRLLIVDDKVAVAAVAFREITEMHRQRMRRYLRLLNLHLELLENFYPASLEITPIRV